MKNYQCVLFLTTGVLVFVTCRKRDVPTPLDSCNCPVDFLFHKESRQQTDSGTFILTLPEAGISLEFLKKKPSAVDLNLGALQRSYDNSAKQEQEVVPGSAYETSNIKLNQLKIFWVGMCRRGFRDDDWSKWVSMVESDFKPVQKERFDKARPAKPQLDPLGLQILKKDAQHMMFRYNYAGGADAQLQVLINFRKDGVWHHWHRNDLVYPLPKDREIELRLYDAGFHQLPDEWEAAFYLLKSGKEPQLIQGFNKSISTNEPSRKNKLSDLGSDLTVAQPRPLMS
jgi:hypothetical protein